jgi:RNA polymerase-binding transcription factor
MATAAGTRYSDLKHLLEQRRHAILNSVVQGVREASADAARAGEVRDTLDEGEAMLQDAVRFSLISMKTGMVIRIDRALDRLAEGSYGACDDCGEDIAESRLRAMPFAERCRRCEELREDVERHAVGTYGPRLGEYMNWSSRPRNP